MARGKGAFMAGWSMLLRSVLAVLGACLSLWWEPSGALAQEEEGRRLFQEGVEAYQRENLEEALGRFEASYAVRPVPNVLYNIAMTLRALERPPEAVNTFRRYIEVNEEHLAPEEVAELDRMISELRPLFGDIVIEVSREGARVVVDGEEIGRSPLSRPVAVSPGEHIISTRLEGYDPVERSLLAEAGRSVTVSLTLSVTRGIDVQRAGEEASRAATDGAGERRSLGWWFWSSAGLSLASTLALVVTGSLTLHYRDEFLESERLDREAHDSAESLAMASDALLGVAISTAALALVSAFVHLVVRRRSDEEGADSNARLEARVCHRKYNP